MNMQVNVLFFGQLNEIVETDQLQLEGVQTVDEARSVLMDRFPGLAACSFQIATNQQLNSNKVLEEGDELALLPPFAGG